MISPNLPPFFGGSRFHLPISLHPHIWLKPFTQAFRRKRIWYVMLGTPLSWEIVLPGFQHDRRLDFARSKTRLLHQIAEPQPHVIKQAILKTCPKGSLKWNMTIVSKSLILDSNSSQRVTMLYSPGSLIPSSIWLTPASLRTDSLQAPRCLIPLTVSLLGLNQWCVIKSKINTSIASLIWWIYSVSSTKKQNKKKPLNCLLLSNGSWLHSCVITVFTFSRVILRSHSWLLVDLGFSGNSCLL